jgi:hypothetical protein
MCGSRYKTSTKSQRAPRAFDDVGMTRRRNTFGVMARIIVIGEYLTSGQHDEIVVVKQGDDVFFTVVRFGRFGCV